MKMKQTDKIQIGRKIKKIRELKNYSQEFVAEKLQLSTRGYSKVESGETKLTIQRLLEISKILELPINKILEFESKSILQNNNQFEDIETRNQPSRTEIELITQYKESVAHLKSEILFLRAQLSSQKKGLK